MKTPDFPTNEIQRQKAIESYEILDTNSEESYDNLTSLLANICEVPISLVSLLDKDRNFLKSHFGVPFNEDPRERSFCGHTILETDGLLIVPDATKDDRFGDNPLVTEMGVRFYAGAALVDRQGIKLGALCVFGTEPKVLTENQIEALKKLANQVMLLMESRLININLLLAENALLERNQELEKFAAATSHDLKSPLNKIVGLLSLLKDSADEKLTEDERMFINLINHSADFLSNYISGILHFYKSDQLSISESEDINSNKLIEEVIGILSAPENKLTFESTVDSINVNKDAICQILMNLISNGLKYNQNETPAVHISISEINEHYCFKVTDNGIGISKESQDKIFELFETANNVDRYGNKGTGIGLATVHKLIGKLGGSVHINSDEGKGSTFICRLPKN